MVGETSSDTGDTGFETHHSGMGSGGHTGQAHPHGSGWPSPRQGTHPFNPSVLSSHGKSPFRGCRQDRTPMGDLPEHMGLAAPGLVSKDGCSIAHMPGRLGLEGLQWQRSWAKRPIPVINDAHAALLGESRHGAAKGMGRSS